MTPVLTAADVARRLTYAGAADALEAALRGGLDPEAEAPRQVLPLGSGELLVMPSAPAVKLVTVGGEPRVQGLCVVFDPETLAPAALVDGIALTTLRTAAVSALAVRRLATPGARRLLIFGRGPQARAHAAAIREVRPIERVDLVGRDRGAADVEALVAAADVICCCTTAREPVLDGSLVAEHATVVAIGSHEPGARETDDVLARRATVVVESRTSALREAGDVILAGVPAGDLVTLAELVRGAALPDGPRLFKSTGMAWEDAVVATALLAARDPSDPEAELRAREPLFHRFAPGTTLAEIEPQIAPGFWEIGASGRRYDRAHVLAIIRQRLEAAEPEPELVPEDFAVRRLAPDLYQATYELGQGDRRSRRCSLWRRTDAGWVAEWHQGTIV